jgi:hypothetical protein
MNKKEAEEYISKLANKFDLTTLSSNLKLKLEKKEKKDKRDNLEEELHIPLVNEYNLFLVTNYSLPELKQICKHYNLKVTGNKSELTKRIYTHLRVTYSIIKLQSIARRFLVKEYLYLYGPAFKNVSLCTNSEDFYSMEPLNELHPFQRFSYKDDDGFIYGFDIISIYNLIKQRTHIELKVENPYNRKEIKVIILENLRHLLYLSLILNIPINIELEEDTSQIDRKKAVELECLRLFQIINSLGNYSDQKWFMELNSNELVRFLRELIDIWTYRAQLTNETKLSICPPYGNPFIHINRIPINRLANLEIDELRSHLLIVIDMLVTSGLDQANKSLGAIYVLGALTIVNEDAANALPWLFQSFA